MSWSVPYLQVALQPLLRGFGVSLLALPEHQNRDVCSVFTSEFILRIAGASETLELA